MTDCPIRLASSWVALAIDTLLPTRDAATGGAGWSHCSTLAELQLRQSEPFFQVLRCSER